MHRPKDVCARLGCSSSTLRRWSEVFAPFLSPTAAAAITEGGGSAHREYSDGDVALLARVQALLKSGLSYAQVSDRLDRGEDVVVFDHMPLTNSPIGELVSVPPALLIRVEGLARQLEERERVIRAQQQTIELQNILLEELRRRPREIPSSVPAVSEAEREPRRPEPAPWWRRLLRRGE